ncbi:hypothetical protein PAXRUDRAFT_22904 [Paxillus rubicundulus Ve08.2h10]|uniref:Uncharacterized protein n=1 Tax=Paxillus rubicundulus Ve08.2h10 TaxID=930991 RepID=A0A0D0CWN7_9AGAM|nr:hypothetical protein PAXRUDRAFT_22904 [Paxillus rubicundulus Ve08.2h10]
MNKVDMEISLDGGGHLEMDVDDSDRSYTTTDGSNSNSKPDMEATEDSGMGEEGLVAELEPRPAEDRHGELEIPTQSPSFWT